jgi:glucokinase
MSTAVVGVDMGGTKCSAVLADRSGRIVGNAYRLSRELPDAVDVLLAVIADLRAMADARGMHVGAVAVGIPAYLHPVTGLVVGGWNLGWQGMDLRARLDEALPEPYTVDNDVNLAALGEARVGAGRGAASFVTVSIGTGLGGAVVVDGRVLRGRHGAAGEFGFLLADREQLRRPGAMGMESRVAGPGVTARARELAGVEPSSDLRGATVDAAAVFAGAARGDRVAGQVITELLEHVAMTIVAVTAVVDPERVILDGSVGRALEPYLPRLVRLVEPSVLYAPEVRISTLAPTAALAGAVAEAWALVGEGTVDAGGPQTRRRGR